MGGLDSVPGPGETVVGWNGRSLSLSWSRFEPDLLGRFAVYQAISRNVRVQVPYYLAK